MSKTLLSQNDWVSIFTDADEATGFPIVIKALRNEFPSSEELTRLNNEYEITQQLSIPGVRRAIRKETVDNRRAIVLTHVDGLTLREAFVRQRQPLSVFIDTAISISHLLGELHAAPVIHKDINSSNILVHLQTGTVSMIDFGISSRIDMRSSYLGNPEKLEGTLAYISPEQTGRMNRMVDYRTDLYSLGVTFYEMLCGTLPFDTKDPSELVHAHIAKAPTPPTSRTPDLPDALSRIVMKLLEKNAEDRYQSAFGLRYDLEQCRDSLGTNGFIADFPLGTRDHSGIFQIQQKLYGREKEIALLLDAFDRTADGNASPIMVLGAPGSGKSALVHELYKRLSARKGNYAEGKFDQFQRDIPYSAIGQALADFARLLLTERDDVLGRWRESILNSLGNLGKVITNLVPQFELVLGTQPELPALGGNESQNRFQYALSQFFLAVATEKHPLVLFIDDLQWADAASLDLLKSLMTSPDLRHLLIIGAYRDNEVDLTHPLSATMQDVAESGIAISHIEVCDLPLEAISQLLADALFENAADVRGFAELVEEKTRGNAFFVRQFLESLDARGAINFDFDALKWRWDVEQIRQLNITDNVVELLANRVKQLPEDVQSVLQYAACIGNSFDIQTLSFISGKSFFELSGLLRAAMLERLIMPADERYKLAEDEEHSALGHNAIYYFVHDRVQQAVHSLIPDDDRAAMHLGIGRLLLQNVPLKHRTERIFDIVFQLNFGLRAIKDADERRMIIELNLIAGNKAKQSSAFQPAFLFFRTAIELLPDNVWLSDYELALALYTEASEAAYVFRDHALTDAWTDEVIRNARDPLDTVRAYMIKLDESMSLNQHNEMLRAGLEVLAKLGVRFPRKPKMAHVFRALAATKMRLAGKKIESLAELPTMTDPQKIFAMTIVERVSPSAFLTGSPLFPLMIFKMVELSIKYGNCETSPYAYACYAITLSGILGDFKAGFRFGQMSLDTLKRHYSEDYEVKVLFVLGVFINHWNRPITETFDLLQKSYITGLKVGNVATGYWSAFYRLCYQFLHAAHLAELDAELGTYLATFTRMKHHGAMLRSGFLRQVIWNLIHPSAEPANLNGEYFSESIIEANETAGIDKTGIFGFHGMKTMLAYLYGDNVQALKHIDLANSFVESAVGLFELTTFRFYEALARLRAVDESTPRDRKKHFRKVGSQLRKMKKWAASSPANYLHRYHAVLAERSSRLGERESADKLFAQALEESRASGYLQEAALIEELACEHYTRVGDNKSALEHSRTAYSAYEHWGAHAKAAHFLARHPQAATNESISISGEHGQTVRTSYLSLDLSSLMKASTAISSAVRLRTLVERLLTICIESAGAERAVLLLPNDDGSWHEQAIGMVDLQNIAIEFPDGNSSFDVVSPAILQYVSRTRESVVLIDAMSDHKFGQDKYLSEHRIKSVLGLPILNLSTLTGILYLENNLVAGAFSQQRIEVLQLLSGQIAISLDNAKLYENLEQKVEERTRELADEKQKSDDLLLNIIPFETAEELKLNGFVKPRKFDEVTVMFTDFANFSSVTREWTAEQVVRDIDYYFSAFDEIVGRHGLEKIKTIGDSYMCAAGIRSGTLNGASDMISAAREILLFIEGAKQDRGVRSGAFDCRIGIHLGPVAAGIVGTKKFAYDIWGDTVNVASRMESSGEPGRINISGSVFERVKEIYPCTHRGQIQAKNIGAIDMYFVEG